MATAALIILAWTAGIPLWASITTTILAGLHLGLQFLQIRIKGELINE